MYKRILFISIFALSFPVFADPWGKDADLVHFNAVEHQKKSDCQKSPSLTSKLAIRAIQFHQDVISPADGPRSNFIPSSSQYTLEAMNKYGFFQGYIMGCDRLMRENDEEWVYRKTTVPQGCKMKWDPIP